MAALILPWPALRSGKGGNPEDRRMLIAKGYFSRSSSSPYSSEEDLCWSECGKPGRQHRASYATLCQCILDAWHKVTATSIIRGFAKADIIPGFTSNSIKSAEADDSEDEDTGDTCSGLLDATVVQLMISNTED
ncbi:hypothetical protein TURU_093269 [Turdus rufiventris]|nr:hypothetical protein TURU_093269 [Turdus rufiventris]